MSCCGKHKTREGKPILPMDNPGEIMPDSECVFCAEKHVSTAYALACEVGYATPNRQRIVGELVACQWHVWKREPKLAMSIRAARHLIQQRREAEVEWAGMLAEIDALARKELEQP